MAKALVLGGATGLLGQALMKTLHQRGWETESLGRQDGDILNMRYLSAQLTRSSPDVVFNTVAWTQVDDAEDNPEDALEMNRTFPDALARCLANMDKGHLVHYSTDFVFGCPQQDTWRETDKPCPDSVYGKTKLEGEKAVLSILPDRSCVLRTAWLFGPGRKNFVQTILSACQKRNTVSVVDDQTGSPTYTMDLADWSSRLAEKRATGLWHAVNSGHATWCELAAEAVNLTSAACKVTPITTDQWPQKAKRPVYSVLDNSKLAAFLGFKPRPWQMALRDYLFRDLSLPVN